MSSHVSTSCWQAKPYYLCPACGKKRDAHKRFIVLDFVCKIVHCGCANPP